MLVQRSIWLKVEPWEMDIHIVEPFKIHRMERNKIHYFIDTAFVIDEKKWKKKILHGKLTNSECNNKVKCL